MRVNKYKSCVHALTACKQAESKACYVTPPRHHMQRKMCLLTCSSRSWRRRSVSSRQLRHAGRCSCSPSYRADLALMPAPLLGQLPPMSPISLPAAVSPSVIAASSSWVATLLLNNSTAGIARVEADPHEGWFCIA